MQNLNLIDILVKSNNTETIRTYNLSAISESILGDYYIQEYYKILEYGVVSFLLCSVLALLAYIFSLNSIKDSEKLSEYECGFEPFDSATRLPFDVHFYIVGILFLIFDVEIAVLYPWVLGLKFIGWYGYYTMLLFLAILTVGFIYEWQRGALNWPASQYQDNLMTASAVSLFSINSNMIEFSQNSTESIILNFFDFNLTSYTQSLELYNLSGELFLAFAICVGFVIASLVSKQLNSTHKSIFTLYINDFSIWSLVITSLLFITTKINWTNATPLFSQLLIVDTYSMAIKLLINFTVILILLSSNYYLVNRSNSNVETPLLILLATLFLLILVSAFNLFTAFMCIIGFSIILYVLILSDVADHAQREASIKYYYLSVYSSGFLIFGIFLVFLITQSLNYTNIKVFIHNFMLAVNSGILDFNNASIVIVLLTISLISLLIGILFKLAAFPCHFWAPEIYDGSPNIITAFLILPVKISVFAFFLRLFAYVFFEVSSLWKTALVAVAALSMLWGCFCAIKEFNIKRFIAYTSINQIGFLLIGIASATFVGFQTSLIYLFLYVLMNIAFLAIFLNTYEINSLKELTYFSEFRSLKFKQLTQMFCFTIIIFSMAGIPPFAGFFGKYFLFVEALNSNLYLLVIIGLFTSLISTYYYIRIIKISFFEPVFKKDNTALDMNEFVQYFPNMPQFIGWLTAKLHYDSLVQTKETDEVYLTFNGSENIVSSFIGYQNWFKNYHFIVQCIYYISILFLVIFVLIVNYVWNSSFILLCYNFWPLTFNLFLI